MLDMFGNAQWALGGDQKKQQNQSQLALLKFRKSFVFFAEKYRSRGGTSHHLSEMNLMFLESVEHREWEKLQS